MTTDNGERTVADDIQHTLRWLVRATIMVYAVMFVFVLGLGYVAVQNREVAIQVTDSICALRHDFEDRIVTSEKFLKENPDGIEGISAEFIRSQITNLEETVQALSIVDCTLP